MNADEMRAALLKVYDGEKWRRKIKSMGDNQVIAIYYKMVASGKIK